MKECCKTCLEATKVDYMVDGREIVKCAQYPDGFVFAGDNCGKWVNPQPREDDRFGEKWQK